MKMWLFLGWQVSKLEWAEALTQDINSVLMHSIALTKIWRGKHSPPFGRWKQLPHKFHSD